MTECNSYNPDSVFTRFKVIEFPITFVGLSTTNLLDVETNLVKSAYLKTMCNGSLMKYAEAREISASHRAFTLSKVNDHTMQITFKPINECISHMKRKKGSLTLNNRFVFDLRLIQVDGVRCCNIELHSEIGRYYVSGQYDFLKLSHFPKIIDFGEIVMNTQVTKHVRIRNESNIATRIEYIKVPGFNVLPEKFLIYPNSSKLLSVRIKPNVLKMKNIIAFRVRNPHNTSDYISEVQEQNKDDDNFLPYHITCKLNIIFKQKRRNLVIESLHKLNEPELKYTFIDEVHINEHNERKKEALKHLQICKSKTARKSIVEKPCTGKDNIECYSDFSRRLPENFCKNFSKKVDTYGLFDIILVPYQINFGLIGLNTQADQTLYIKNNTKCDITIRFAEDNKILYTDEKLSSWSIKIKSSCDTQINVFCSGFEEGKFNETFEYIIDNKFCRRHQYVLEVGNAILTLQEQILKFGMTSSESFITSVPVRIYNHFNIPVDYRWDEFNSDVPFHIIPTSGTIQKHSCMICDVFYICKPTKTKIHEVNFVSESNSLINIPVELNIITRKVSIKFLQPAIIFKDIALNIETIERVKLENSSREIATFIVLEPLIPGLKIVPMSGNIRPKMVMIFDVIVKISCVLEFAFDITIKINNKENVTIPVSGNVVEPKIIIHPKNILMARVPCHMTTYVPVTIHNLSDLKTEIEVLNTGDDNIFNVYIAYGNEKQRIFKFSVEGGKMKTVFVRVLDVFRREYDMYIPFKINELLGPPEHNNSDSTLLQYYISDYEKQYDSNIRVKIKSLNKEINFCRVTGVITVPWIQLTPDTFEIEYSPNEKNEIDFTMTNVSKYYLHVTIMTAKLSPVFTLDLRTEDNESIINENNIKFELDRGKVVAFSLKFHPKMHGRYVSTAILFLDKHMTIPYHNLTFVGKRQNHVMVPSAYRVIFPPTYVGVPVSRIVTIKMEIDADLDEFSCMSKDEPNLSVKFLNCEIIEEPDETYTLLTVEIGVCCKTTYTQHIVLTINHAAGSGCEIEIIFCYTYCTLTLHANFLMEPNENPYPYFPLKNQSQLFDYMTTCTEFLEKWMYQQGFRRDLYPVIPDTFLAISTALSSQPGTSKSKGINVSYLNFIRRIAGPLMKYIRKITAIGVLESFKCVKEVHDTYKEIINLIRSRGADLWMLQAKFLLSYDQFVIFTENVTPKCNSDILYTQELLADADLFNRLNKQCWIDFILQSYKVFIMDSCFFDCVCVNSQPRDIVNVLIDWYNELIALQHKKLRGTKAQVKQVSNITTDLCDGIAVMSVLLYYCPFLEDKFTIFSEVDDKKKENGIINNACIIIEAMNQLRLYFPLISKDFLEPNFLQMLFLSIHLYVTLPMFTPKDTIYFTPPLLRSSTRHIGVSPASQESLTFTFMILNNSRNNFTVEKSSSFENGKKMFLSVKYIANFTRDESSILLVHGYNKTRIFDTYMVFLLKGSVGDLNPARKCKVTGSLYRPNKVDILVATPFSQQATFSVYITDIEPTKPVVFEESTKSKFYLRRLSVIDKEITLSPLLKESGQEQVPEYKLYLQLICLSTQVGTSWIWFRSEVGEFFVRVTTQPRWDLAIDTLQAKVQSWPVDPCSCGEACECYRTTLLLIPHQNELMVKALRYSLLEHASDVMMQIFDQLIESTTGKIILGMLLAEGGTNMSDVQHILRNDIKYRISSKNLLPRLDRVVLAHHTPAMLPLPVTIPAQDKSEKYSIIFTSECGMDIRTYRIIFIESAKSLGQSA